MRVPLQRVRWGILTLLLAVLWVPPAPAAPDQDQDHPVPQLAEVMAPTPWGPPQLVSPLSNAALFHFPRATTLVWRPVIGADSYRLERAWYSNGWNPYPVEIVRGNTNTSFTFDFIGDQKGRWRVFAMMGGAISPPSAYRTFSYDTGIRMPTPVPTSPANNVVFDHFPRWTTLAWKMTPGFGYKLEIVYCLADKVTCWPYAPIVIADPLHAYHTFQFVGAQPGKWRVTALGGVVNGLAWSDSTPSAWRWFTYSL